LRGVWFALGLRWGKQISLDAHRLTARLVNTYFDRQLCEMNRLDTTADEKVPWESLSKEADRIPPVRLLLPFSLFLFCFPFPPSRENGADSFAAFVSSPSLCLDWFCFVF
jgi:hypothetical protein